ncbi:MAG: hypothetical protein HYZ15_11710 [Sphingobacteriales bacterium]|nr:hypothetical protein [Sphingobacteriales bacterium]
MKRNTLLFAILLSVPVGLFLLQHYFYHSPELYPTGFTVDENVLYMSYARQYNDQPAFSLFYSNPFDGDPASPRIYFQPVNLLLAALIKTGADPGLSFSLFGLLMTILCVYTGLLILRHLLGEQKNQGLISLLFTWGGGFTALAGFGALLFLPGQTAPAWLDAIHIADPASGWWGLNWGRNLFIPLEAWYHFLFLLNIYLLLKQRWAAGLFTAFFLSISHPFTGIEYLLIINGWLFFEKIVYKNKTIPYKYWAGIFLVTLFHTGYYLYYLNRFPEHRLLFSQYSAGWTYSLRIAMAAYLIVFVLSFFALRINKRNPILSQPHQRLFLCWAVIAFLLSKHEWFMQPLQPVHFTRGYIWAGLFLFSLPVLAWLLNTWKSPYRKVVLALLIIFFLADNVLWTYNVVHKKDVAEWEGHITRETRDVLNYLGKETTVNDLLTGNAALVNYLSNVYSPANAWISHPYNTPDRAGRKTVMEHYLLTGEKPAAWNKRRILLLLDRKYAGGMAIHSSLLKNKIFENNRYSLFIP